MSEASIGLHLAGSWEQSGAEGWLSPSEALLVEGLRSGEEDAYESLVDLFQQPVYNLVCRLLNDCGEACDVTQDVFVKVFRSIGGFRGQSSLKTWIYRIAVNEAHNHNRWYWRNRGREVGLDDEQRDGTTLERVLPDTGRSPYEIALEHETRDRIEMALGMLKPAFRAAVILRDLEGMSYEEVAEVLQVTLGTVKSRILRGREALRQLLSEAEWTQPQLALATQRVG